MSMASEILTKLKTTMNGDATLMSYLGSDNAKVRSSFIPVAFAVPLVTFHEIAPAPDNSINGRGVFDFRIQLNVFDVNTSTGMANIFNIRERIDYLFLRRTLTFTTTNYTCHLVNQVSGWQDIYTGAPINSQEVVHSFSEYVFRILTN